VNRAFFVLSLLTACAATPPATLPAPPATSSIPPPAPTPTASAIAAPAPPPPSYEAEAREVLDEMVAVDTSHGNETKLLDSIAARYRREGVPVQILESSPGRGNLIARVKGSGAKKPLLLLAHVDVVPIEGQPWTVPAFNVTEKDGFLWGRGVNDDKGMAAAIVALTLEFARSKAPLTRDIIVALTAGEETGGFAGARWLTENHKELLDAEIALNEGGGLRISDDMQKPMSLSVGVSEKIFQTYKLVVRGKGGHSAVPPPHNDPVLVLSRALVKVGEMRMPPHVLPEVKADFQAGLARADKKYVDALKHVIASAPKVDPADDKILSENAGYNASIRTTCITTMLQGSPQDNVLPTTAEATINCRILPIETRQQVKDAITKVIGDPKVEVTMAPSYGDAPGSPFEGEVVDAVKKVAAATYPGADVLPNLGFGTTDSRFLRGIGIRSYGVSPGVFSFGEAMAGHLAHGPDERRPVNWVAPGLRFFREVVRTLVL
jgi:acetylornithine deacetylase/succinyl-diaminopimelate desuccinylase-like protein